MKLQNPFSQETRELFRDCWQCWECGENGQRTGGLELHHITGRDSNSPLNASILCKGCHAHALHTNDEEAGYTMTTMKYLYGIGYSVTERDTEHLSKHPYLVTTKLVNWLKTLLIKTGH
jgi:hypothetical protein